MHCFVGLTFLEYNLVPDHECLCIRGEGPAQGGDFPGS